jgi:hypothetical protein
VLFVSVANVGGEMNKKKTKLFDEKIFVWKNYSWEVLIVFLSMEI